MIYTILIGGLVGWLAGKIMKGGGFGIVKNVLLGIIGGIIGHWVLNLVKVVFLKGVVGDVIMGLAGALIILYIADSLKKK